MEFALSETKLTKLKKNKKNIVFYDKLGGGSDVFFLTEEEAYVELSRIFQAMQDELEAEAEWVAMEGGSE